MRRGKYTHSAEIPSPSHKQVSVAMTPLALRSDLGSALTVGRFLPSLVTAGFTPAVTGPILDIAKRTVSDQFILRYLDFLSFAISGLPADSTIAAAMAYTLRSVWIDPCILLHSSSSLTHLTVVVLFDVHLYHPRDLHQADAELDYPVGGSGAIVDALVRAVNRHGHRNQGKGPEEPVEDRVALSAHVNKVLIDDYEEEDCGFGRRWTCSDPCFMIFVVLGPACRSLWRTGAPSASSCARAGNASGRGKQLSPTPASGMYVRQSENKQ